MIYLQDAARKSGTGRRLLGRRSGAAGAQQSSTATSSSSGGSSAKDKIQKKKESEMRSQLPDSSSKSYLLNKLLQGL